MINKKKQNDTIATVRYFGQLTTQCRCDCEVTRSVVKHHKQSICWYIRYLQRKGLIPETIIVPQEETSNNVPESEKIDELVVSILSPPFLPHLYFFYLNNSL